MARFSHRFISFYIVKSNRLPFSLVPHFPPICCYINSYNPISSRFFVFCASFFQPNRVFFVCIYFFFIFCMIYTRDSKFIRRLLLHFKTRSAVIIIMTIIIRILSIFLHLFRISLSNFPAFFIFFNKQLLLF